MLYRCSRMLKLATLGEFVQKVKIAVDSGYNREVPVCLAAVLSEARRLAQPKYPRCTRNSG